MRKTRRGKNPRFYAEQMTKSALRKKLIEQRKSMNPLIKISADTKIALAVMNDTAYKKTDTVFCYVSSAIEVDTSILIENSLSSGKTVAVPKCFGEDMRLFRIHSLDGLEKGAFGILEPTDLSEETAPDENSVCIVPALAFDCDGYRLGYGKGYYDRFLSEYKGVSIGIIYDEYIIAEIPKDKFDIAVNNVISDKGKRR